MLRAASREDHLVKKLIGTGSRKGKTFFSRAGDIIQRPPSWAAVAGLLAATGPRGRRAALRGGVCYLSAAAAHLPIKAVVGRRHPRGSALHQLGPFTSSFPSGHAASDLAFVFGAAQELPAAFVPLSCASLAVHWSLIRKRAHYPSDVLAGGALGIGVALAVRKLWPPQTASAQDRVALRSTETQEAGGGGHGGEPSDHGAVAPSAVAVDRKSTRLNSSHNR
jgi:membrane-associated phospholipid phosphatase